jgi:hypothetical protein
MLNIDFLIMVAEERSRTGTLSVTKLKLESSYVHMKNLQVKVKKVASKCYTRYAVNAYLSLMILNRNHWYYFSSIINWTEKVPPSGNSGKEKSCRVDYKNECI